MAISFKSNIDLGGLALQFATLHPASAAPTSPAASEGQVYWNTGDDKLYVYNGSSWIDVSGDVRQIDAGTGISVSGGSGGTATVSLSHLGLESLAARSEVADAIFFYDVSAATSAYLTCDTTTGIRIDGTDLELYNIPNASLANSSVTVSGGNGMTSGSGGSVSLGGSITMTVGAGLGITVNTDDVAIKNATNFSDNTILMWDDTNGQLVDSAITDDGTTIELGSDSDTRNLIVSGNLTVEGTTTTIDSNTVNIGDNILVLNADETGTPSQDAGIEIERGTATNKKFYWDEGLDSWRVDGQLIIDDVPAHGTLSTQSRILTEKTDATDTTIQQTTVGAIGTALGVGGHVILLDAVNRDNVAKSGNVFTVTHGLGTKFVNVQVIDASTHETVFVEVARPTTTTVTVSFAQTVANGDYYCMTSLVGSEDTSNIGN